SCTNSKSACLCAIYYRTPHQSTNRGDRPPNQQSGFQPQEQGKNMSEVEVEVFDHLIFTTEEGDRFYRLYGRWICTKCKKGWTSAWTYVRLEKYEARISPKKLKKERDYFTQQCKNCPKGNSVGFLKEYKHLKKSNEDKDEKRPHLKDLCEKCKQGYYCGERSRR
ncbi:hypothetical protein BC938DRAFT_480429, partial [Jimgerdemannia flammicorona]